MGGQGTLVWKPVGGRVPLLPISPATGLAPVVAALYSCTVSAS